MKSLLQKDTILWTRHPASRLQFTGFFEIDFFTAGADAPPAAHGEVKVSFTCKIAGAAFAGKIADAGFTGKSADVDITHS